MIKKGDGFMTKEEMKPLIELADQRVRDNFYHGREVSKWVKANDPVWQARFANTLRAIKDIVEIGSA